MTPKIRIGGIMKRGILTFTGLGLFFIVVLFTISPSHIFAEENNKITAKIGLLIERDGNKFMASSASDFRIGDSYRIYINTDTNCFIYLVYADHDEVGLLKRVEQNLESPILILPSAIEYYQVDQTSDNANLTIICAPHQLAKIEKIQTKPITYRRWTSIKNELMKEYYTALSEENSKPVLIGGTIRGQGDGGANDYVAKNLPFYSADEVLIKTYAFTVKK